MAIPNDKQLHYLLPASVRLGHDILAASRSRSTTHTETSEAIYFDTPRRDLTNRGFQLRCQPTDAEAGWQLRRLDGDGAALLAVPLNLDATTPEAIGVGTLGLRAGRDIAEFARIRSEHTSHEIEDSRGHLVGRLTDSVFTSTASVDSSVSAQQWRAVSVVATSKASSALLTQLDRRLRKAGATPATPPATALAIALGVAEDNVGDVVGDYVAAQRGAMLVADVRLRSSARGVGWSLGESGSDDIHDARVAVRRLRSTLRNFAAVFDPRLSQELEIELTWYSAALGRVRDQQVLHDRLLTALAEVPAELVLGPVAATISEHLLLQIQTHRQDLGEVLVSARYLALLDRVDALIHDLADSEPLRARDVRAGLAKAEARLSRRLAEARAQVGTSTADVASHTARKAAKRARYAAELAAPVLDAKRAKAKIKRFQRLQDSLGLHQDGVVAAELLRHLGAAAAQSGQNGFTFGLLYERELAALRAGGLDIGG